ncbi:hypothetical protein [Fusibacter ferrireducens]|uniref:Uncharacterized protein n=1 Tax=Fusibacter ferrireducens TaxID=2785058 RepID=A0ABR9ZVL1_9FIRM|nr:hypothetical protein [Fusibacter ferrireducens]MBF4694203.1 hypothetical protein [Fusibacter ferrireducens]
MSRYILIVFLFQLIIAALHGFRAVKKNKVMPLEKMAIIAFIPVLGLIIPYLGFLFPKKEGTGDLDDLFDHNSEDIKNDIRYEKLVEIEKEVNYVPVEEALILNSSSVKRKLIMDTAKEDASEYLNFLKLAMIDPDMETSHYAASLVMEISRELQNIIQKSAVEYEKDKTNVEHLAKYVENVGKYYNSGLLDENNERRYGVLYSGLIGNLIDLGYFTETLFREKIETDIKLMMHSNIFDWIKRYNEQYPESEKPYLLKMKYYYITNNMDGINQTLKTLKSLRVNITHEGNEIIKYWEMDSVQ